MQDKIVLYFLSHSISYLLKNEVHSPSNFNTIELILEYKYHLPTITINAKPLFDTIPVKFWLSWTRKPNKFSLVVSQR